MIDFTRRQFPLVGFGDDPNSAIKFMVVRALSDSEHAWTGGEAKLVTLNVLHSSDVIQQGGPSTRLPRELTVRLWFPDRASLAALDDVQGATATLRVAWHMLPDAGATMQTLAGQRYAEYPDTTLVSLTDQSTPRGRHPQATATFRRAVGSTSTWGFALYSED